MKGKDNRTDYCEDFRGAFETACLWGDVVKLIQELEKIRAVENFDPDMVTCEQGDKKKAVLLTINGLNIINAMAQLYMSVIIQ